MQSCITSIFEALQITAFILNSVETFRYNGIKTRDYQPLIDNILSKWMSPHEVQQSLAAAFKSRRRSRKHSRREASIRTGVPEATIRRFENTGEISLRQFLMLCHIYGDLAATDSLLPKPAPLSMDELLRTTREQT